MTSSPEMTTEEVLDPTPNRDESNEIPLATRLDTLKNKTVTLYSNNKANSDDLLRAVGSELSKEFPEANFSDVVEKNHTPTSGLKEGLIQETAPESDAVILAMGDCGSCSTYLINDAIEFEKRKVPTVSLCSTKFNPLCQYNAFHMGCSGLPIVEFEHPVIRMTIEELRNKRVTQDLLDETVTALTAPVKEIEEEWRSRYSDSEFDEKPQFDKCTI